MGFEEYALGGHYANRFEAAVARRNELVAQGYTGNIAAVIARELFGS